jgi:hypothetical protein
MVLRRLTANLRAQNWIAIIVEFILVIVGVFLGILAANWNLERLERRETGRLLSQLDSELTPFIASMDSITRYYGVSDQYADQAKAGWRGDPSVSDNQFVIAAYQASQINGIGNNSLVWAQIFGAENLRNIDDTALRRSLRQALTFDYSLVNLAAAMSRYREEVRKVIPDDLQAAIRAECGDILLPDGNLVLPARCGLVMPTEEVARTARALRARGDLVPELNWHQAKIVTQMQNLANLRSYCVKLTERID